MYVYIKKKCKIPYYPSLNYGYRLFSSTAYFASGLCGGFIGLLRGGKKKNNCRVNERRRRETPCGSFRGGGGGSRVRAPCSRHIIEPFTSSGPTTRTQSAVDCARLVCFPENPRSGRG